jgi:ATP-binding cassette subfamily B protein
MTDAHPLPGRRRVAMRMAAAALRADPKRAVATGVLTALVAASGSLFALGFRAIVEAIGRGDRGGALAAATSLGVTIFAWSVCDYAGSRVGMVLFEKARYLAERELLAAVAGSPGLEIHENPEHLVQLERLESEGREFSQAVPSLASLLFNVVWAATTFVLLAGVHPLLLLLPAFGLPSLLLSGRTNGLFTRGSELAAEPERRARAWWNLVTTPASARELRVSGMETEALRRFRADQAEVRQRQQRLQLEARLIGVGTRTIFAAGYIAAIVFVVHLAVAGQASVGDVLLTAALAGQVLNLINNTSEVVQWSLRTMTAAGRFVYLLDVAGRGRRRGVDGDPPRQLKRGIALEGVTYTYPGRTAPALAGVDLRLPAGSTIAIVGDNGAGKSTLVKLLCGLYTPDSGRIVVDGVDLAAIAADAWKARVSAAFQDFARIELSLHESVGIGDLEVAGGRRIRLPATDRVKSAIGAAGAHRVLEQLGGDVESVLGVRYADGSELSVGQWQLVALSRALLRREPLLLVLDEPTAALDPAAERALWDRYAAESAAAAARAGAITVIVSHRLSTVRGADLIIVVDAGGIAEVGDHATLIAAGGPYAELFNLQARAYS